MALLPSNANGPPVLFIAAGQSNAVGRTATAASESAPEAGVFFDWRSDQLVFNDLADPVTPPKW
jgi:ferric-dicitrate binding protein FerR (iron transport regulator)